MLIVGLTGGIGSGKSTVANEFKAFNINIIDTDVISHSLINKGEPALDEIITTFGKEYLTENGDLDRKKMRELVFNSSTSKRKLENILQPRIRTKVKEQLAQLKEELRPYCMVVVPLLVETKFQQLVDRILVVTASKEEQLRRLCARDHITQELALKMIQSQTDDTERLKHADEVIKNTEDLITLKQEVAKLHAHYLNLAKQHH